MGINKIWSEPACRHSVIYIPGGLYEEEDTLYILDVKDMYFYTSNVQCPKDGVYRAVILTTYG